MEIKFSNTKEKKINFILFYQQKFHASKFKSIKDKTIPLHSVFETTINLFSQSRNLQNTPLPSKIINLHEPFPFLFRAIVSVKKDSQLEKEQGQKSLRQVSAKSLHPFFPFLPSPISPIFESLPECLRNTLYLKFARSVARASTPLLLWGNEKIAEVSERMPR